MMFKTSLYIWTIKVTIKMLVNHQKYGLYFNFLTYSIFFHLFPVHSEMMKACAPLGEILSLS